MEISWPWKSKKYKKPSVTVKHVDTTIHIPHQSEHQTILNCLTPPKSKIIFIGTSINRIKWYQFWRWHLVKQYKKECEEAKQKFIDTFGSPTSKGNLSSLNNTSKVHIIRSSSDE